MLLLYNPLFSFFIGQPYLSSTWTASCTASTGLVVRTRARWSFQFSHTFVFLTTSVHSSAVRRCLLKSSFSTAGYEQVNKLLHHSLLHEVCWVHIFMHHTVYTQQMDMCKRNQKVRPFYHYPCTVIPVHQVRSIAHSTILHTYSRQKGPPWVFSHGQLLKEHANTAKHGSRF